MEEVLTEKASAVNLYVKNSPCSILGLEVQDSFEADGDGWAMEIVVAAVEIVVHGQILYVLSVDS